MSLAAKLPYDHAYAGGYPGIGSQPLPTDADALDYLARVKAADGAGVEVGVATAVSAFVADSKALGVWDSIRASCVLAGARTLAGALVPLRDYGPELVDINSLESPSINNLGGSAGYWDAASRTAYSTATGAAGYPYFVFPVSVVVGKTYRFSGVLSGDFADINLFRFGNLNVTIAEDGSFDASLVANFADFKIYFESSLGPQAVTIDSLSIREVIAAPTNVADGFVEGDYTRGGATPGLKGDGTSYLDSGRANDADPQNDNHVAAYVTAGYVAINNGALIGAQNAASAYTMTGTVSYNRGSIGNSAIQITSAGLYASSRKTQASFLYIRPPDNAQSLVSNSVVASGFSNNLFVYGYSNSSGSLVSPTDATVAFYSAGTGMDSDGLAALDTAVSNLITAIGEAL